jgi:hypothetical protein
MSMKPKEAIAIAESLVFRAATAEGAVDDTTWAKLRRAGACAKAHAIAPGLVELSMPSPNDERSWPKVKGSADSILTAFRASDYD